MDAEVRRAFQAAIEKDIFAICGSLKQLGPEHYTFNAYVKNDACGFGAVIAGLRVIQGKLTPPARFNPGTKRYFNILFVSRKTAEAIYQALHEAFPELALLPLEGAIGTLTYSAKSIAKLIPEAIAA